VDSLPRRVLLAARDLGAPDEPVRDTAARTIHDLLSTATVADITALAARARTSFAHHLFGAGVPVYRPYPPTSLDVFLPPHRLSVAGLLSMHRNGFVRELGVEALVESPDPFVVPFLLLRCDDIVASLRSRAESAIAGRLREGFAPAFAESLQLLDQLAGRERGGKSSLVASVHRFLALPPQRPALEQACGSPSPAVRRLAYGLRLRHEPPLTVLQAALGDPAIGVHVWAARTAASAVTPEADQRVLVHQLTRSRSAWVRALALRRLSKLEPSDAPLEAALVDHHAAVRLCARELLRARHPQRTFRATHDLACALLGQPDLRQAAALVGALGALSDVGTKDDLTLVHRFTEDPRPRVRREAERTLVQLGWAEGGPLPAPE
jgi:HEAT repeat protein